MRLKPRKPMEEWSDASALIAGVVIGVLLVVVLVLTQ